MMKTADCVTIFTIDTCIYFKKLELFCHLLALYDYGGVKQVKVFVEVGRFGLICQYISSEVLVKWLTDLFTSQVAKLEGLHPTVFHNCSR